ncbi:hypothetical protein COU49_01390 [Candidatus Nomurabacteria bacterium CG10_big_fil_rev_8_21_14_0_10_35_16]|uniref:TrbL/VirB6 plasmid conjugal transfer protein n=1 Tax=Candidatus Nomurabacteria bacterium CG10_big_fil_rev_8_21_14_0_10_35_16 TaxID=1974731 RepID=A0A2H0TBH5_9BACT|nr:MAG: hypothetical protein COU49_01390 [Candidatus Nomurabacteria bacterium CG10_big_fil_rev_8_21_14_0_10_35_16]
MKKFLPYILILVIIFVGFFSLAPNVQAQESEYCLMVGPHESMGPLVSEEECRALIKEHPNDFEWITGTYQPSQIEREGGTEGNNQTDFEKILDEECSLLHPMGCIASFAYYTYFSVPALILSVSAIFFNTIISITLDGGMYSGDFLSSAWVVTRDLSNIFFILILLYIAFQTILGLGGHGGGPKKMIAQVIIMALLINFSMFFTKVIIDSSNILALVFYNRMNVQTKNSDGSTRDYSPKTKGGTDKDISGGLVKNFDATKLVSQDFFEQAKTIETLTGEIKHRETVPLSIKLGMIFISGSIMLFAAYAFFISGLSFVKRLLELWVLMIFSPFAFMSSTVPILSNIEDIGWKGWFHRVLSASFMAPIFMFFMYFIFKILNSGIFDDSVPILESADIFTKILLILIPALIVLELLMKATDWAKKGAGKFGDVALKGIQKTGGFMAGATIGGGAMLGTGLLGGGANKLMGSKLGSTLRGKEKEAGFTGFAARAALRTADYGTRASFDLRNVPGIGGLAKAGGLNLGSSSAIGLGARTGGYEKRREEKTKRRQERAKRLEVREDEPLKQELNKVEKDLQDLLATNSHEIELIDKKITSARQNLNDANARFGAGSSESLDAGKILADLKGQRSARKNATAFTDSFGITYDFTWNTVGGVPGGASINQLEDTIMPEARHKVEAESKARKRAYADRIGGKKLWGSTNREAAHKIRMGAKLDSGAKEGNH